MSDDREGHSINPMQSSFWETHYLYIASRHALIEVELYLDAVYWNVKVVIVAVIAIVMYYSNFGGDIPNIFEIMAIRYREHYMKNIQHLWSTSKTKQNTGWSIWNNKVLTIISAILPNPYKPKSIKIVQAVSEIIEAFHAWNSLCIIEHEKYKERSVFSFPVKFE